MNQNGQKMSNKKLKRLILRLGMIYIGKRYWITLFLLKFIPIQIFVLVITQAFLK